MTRRSASSFLVRLEWTGLGTRGGTVTSVGTGERAPFGGLEALVRILEAWHDVDAPQQQEEESH